VEKQDQGEDWLIWFHVEKWSLNTKVCICVCACTRLPY